MFTRSWFRFGFAGSISLALLAGAAETAPAESATREIQVDKKFLNLPVKNGAPKRHVSFIVDGKAAREFDMELADGEADWWAFMDLTPFQGKQAAIKVDNLPGDSRALRSIEQDNIIKDASDLYAEKLRPQFHFSSRRGWNNDPNGLVFYKGEYHLFYQHNPYGWDWGNMHWGHAVSPDLIHWRELSEALYPDEHGTMFSGSAVVDWNNAAGFQTGAEKVLICIFAAAGNPFTQGLAYSNDRGRTWSKYDKNPVVPNLAEGNRDPKVFWYAPDKKWVMALYLDKNNYALLSSLDLKKWERMSTVTIPGTTECPEFFEIGLDGRHGGKRWIFYGGNGRYLIGAFDGKTFTPESGPHTLEYGNAFYASQTYNDIPLKDGRRILIPWGQVATPGMPFNQMMGIPVELTLRTTDEGPRLLANPVKELGELRAATHAFKAQALNSGANPLHDINGELFDIVADISPGEASEVGFDLRGIPVSWDAKKQVLTCRDKSGPLKLVEGKIKLRFLIDRTSIDIFGNDGRLYTPMGAIIPQDNRSLRVYARGGSGRINSLEVCDLTSAWK